MKAIKFFSTLFCFLTIFARAFAQTEIPVTSLSQLRAESILASAGVEGWVSSSASNGSTSVGSSWIPGTKNSSDILTAAKLSLKIEVVDTTASIQTHVAIVDKEGELLFEGYTDAKPELVNGAWALPKTAGDIQLKMPWAKWITLSKAVSQAWIVARDQQGVESFYELAVNGSKILFPTASMGLQNAYVKSNFTDGSSSAWTISDGKQRQVTTIATNPVLKFNDIISLKNQSAQAGQVIKHVIQVTKGVGVIPTFEIIMDTDSTIAIDVTTSAGGRPSGYMFKAPGSTTWTSWPVSLVNTDLGTPMRALKGTMYVVPVFKPEILIEAAYPVQTGGGGKG